MAGSSLGKEPASSKPLVVFSLDLAGRRHCFVPVVLDMQFRRFLCVIGCVVQMSLCRVRVVSGCLMVTLFVMTGGFTMVICRKFVVFRCFAMVLRCLF